jgi:hypothetical protein
MLNGVGDCLLSDAIKMRCDGVVVDCNTPVETKFTANLEQFPGIFRQLLQRCHQTMRVECDRGQTAREHPRARDRVADAHGNHGCLFGFGFRFGQKVALQHVAHQLDASEALAQIVVQVLADAALLALANFEHFTLEALALGDVDARSDDAFDRTPLIP